MHYLQKCKPFLETEAGEVFNWIKERGFNFHFGSDLDTQLTESQVLDQCKMYIAACRIGERFGCDAIGIQYQQGLKDVCSASDLVEGMLNSSDRPPVKNIEGKVILKVNLLHILMKLMNVLA